VGNGLFAVAHAIRFRIDSVGKIAGIACQYCRAAAGDFAHPTGYRVALDNRFYFTEIRSK